MKLRTVWLLAALGSFSSGCTPTVQLAMPNEPININLNAKIEHQIYIKMDQELDNLFDSNEDLF